MRVGRANGDDWLRLGDAAAELGVSLNTLRRWSDAGKLKCYRSPGGHRRYRRADVEVLLRAESAEAGEARTPWVRRARATEEPEGPLLALARAAAEGVGVSTCRIWLAGGDKFTVLAEHGTSDDDRAGLQDSPPQPPQSAVREVVRTGRRLVIADLATTTLLDRDDADRLRRHGLAALLAVPIALGRPDSAVLELSETRSPRAFSGANVAFAEFMAGQAAHALFAGDRGDAPPPGPAVDLPGDGASAGRTTVVDSAAEQLRRDLGPDASAGATGPVAVAPDPTPDAESLVRSTLTALRALAAVDVCTLYSVEQGVAAPYPEDDAGGRPVDGGRPWRVTEGPVAAVLDASEPVVLTAQDGDPDVGSRFLHTRGLAGAAYVPVPSRGRLVGLLELGSATREGLTLSVQVAPVAADLLALALTSDEATARLQRRNRDLALVAEAGLEDTARLSTDDILHAVAKRLSELTRTPVADIYAVEGDTLRALVSYDGGRFDEEWRGVILPVSRYPCSRRAVETGELVVVASLDDPLLDDEGRYSLEKWGYQAQLSMPLVAHGHVLGAVDLSDYRPRDFTEDLDLIRGLCQVAAYALENASLFEQVERRNRILNELVKLATLASGARDVSRLAATVAESVLTTVDAANCDIYRMEEGVLVCAASYDRSGHDTSVLGSVFDLERYPTTLEAMQNHQILTITSPDDPQLNEDERRTYHDYGFASEVCLPLVVGDELFGLLDLYDTRERDFAEYVTFLRSVAQTLAGAFENARLLEQLEQRGAVLRDIVELGAVASQAHDLETVLTALAERLRDTIDAADCDIFTLRGEQLLCVVSADTNGLDASVVGHVLDIDRFPATALAVQTGQVMIIGDLQDPRLTDEEREGMAEYGFQSELCIPLIGGDRVIGLIDVFDTRPRDYAEYLDFLRSVGQTAAGAIENAMLLEKLERRNAALAELVELGRSASSAGGLTELLRAVGPRVVELMEADGCQVFILRGEMLRCVLTYDDGQFLDDFADQPLDLELFPSTRAAVAEQGALVIESPDDPRLSDYERSLYADSGTQSEICVPLVLEDRVVGLLDVYDHRRRDYAEHRDFLLRVGQLMAGAFENALLMERLEDSNQTLGLLVESGIEFGGTLDPDELLQRVARRLCAAAAAPHCAIHLLRDDRLRCVACIDHGEPVPGRVGAEVGLADLGLARVALDSRRPVYSEDVGGDPRVSELERRADLGWGHRSLLCLPLISRGQVIGVAAVHDDRPRTFDRTDLLHSLAQVAAGALANATLFDELDRSAERMALVSEVSFELSSSLGLGDVLLSTARRLCAVATAPMCDIYILRDGAVLESVTSIDDGEVDAAWQGGRFSLEDWAAMRLAAESRAPVVVTGRDDPRLSAAEVELMERYSESCALLVPLISRERVIGLLELTHRDRHAYSAEETDTIVSICRFAALAIDNAELYEGIKGMHLSNLKALSSALNAKDYYTLGHAARVAAYMVLLGRQLGWDEDLLREVEEAAYLHDIGKIGVPDGVLLKPSGLNSHEWELMRQHPIFSAEIIRPLFDDALVQGVRHHHERWSGEGYPDGLAGDEIPLIARAMCVADSYDAMSFRRPYRQGLTADECLEELERCRGDQFDPVMVAAFRRVLESLAEGRRTAAGIAARAAAALTADECIMLREYRDERRPEYASVAAKLRRVREEAPAARYVTAFARDGRKTLVLADSQADPDSAPRLGDEAVSDDELLEALAGRELQANVLFVDRWGVWISGVAPVLDDDGTVVAVVSVDIPATEGAMEVEGLRSNVAQTFASMLHTAAVQSGRSELEAITDGLTGLYNHRYFHERLSYEIERCQEDGTSIALLFLDLDNFRSFNELHGHGSGDKALRAVARVLEGSVRHVDLVARYGGEEFAAILIDTDEAGALEVAERIRAGITRTVIAGADTLSVSIGVATCPRDATFKDELVDKADWAMYLAKRRGRDTVMTFASEHGGETPEQASVVRPEHVAAMGELIAARAAFRQRRRSVIAQIALGVARLTDVPAEEIQTAVAAVEAGEVAGDTPAGRIVALTAAYESIVTDRPYRARISEAEALDELLGCPALRGEDELTRAFRHVLAR